MACVQTLQYPSGIGDPATDGASGFAALAQQFRQVLLQLGKFRRLGFFEQAGVEHSPGLIKLDQAVGWNFRLVNQSCCGLDQLVGSHTRFALLDLCFITILDSTMDTPVVRAKFPFSLTQSIFACQRQHRSKLDIDCWRVLRERQQLHVVPHGRLKLSFPYNLRNRRWRRCRFCCCGRIYCPDELAQHDCTIPEVVNNLLCQF